MCFQTKVIKQFIYFLPLCSNVFKIMDMCQNLEFTVDQKHLLNVKRKAAICLNPTGCYKKYKLIFLNRDEMNNYRLNYLI